jgi:hypothetical protein
MTRFCSQEKIRTNRNQSLYFLWNTIAIMAFVTIMVMSKWQNPVSWMMLQHDDPVLFQIFLRTNSNQSNINPQPPLFILWYNISTILCSQEKIRTNRNQSLYFLWNTIAIMAFVTIMSTRWIQFKVLRTNSNQSNINPQPPLFILWYNISTIRWLNKTF